MSVDDSMLKTEKARFRVIRRQQGQICLEVMESRDQGRRVHVPLTHESYSDEVRDCLEQLSVGAKIQAVLVCDNPEAPRWRIDRIDANT